MPIYKSIKDIKNNKLFSGVQESVLTRIFDEKEIKRANEGELIYRSGEKCEAIYLIIKGEVKIKFPANNYVVSRIFNDFFGEKELIDETRRISSALAFSNLIFYRLNLSILDRLVEKNPVIQENLLKFGQIKLPDAPTDVERKLKIFERDKPISFKAFLSGKSVEEDRPKEKNPPPVMTQQLLPDLDSIEDSFAEDDNNLVEEELELVEEFTETEETPAEIQTYEEPPTEEIETVPQTVETNIPSYDEPDEVKEDDTILKYEPAGELVSSESGINREVIRKIFLFLNKILSGTNVSELVTNSKRALKDFINSESADLVLIDEKASTLQKFLLKRGVTKSEFFQLSEGLTGICAVEKRTLNFDRPTEDNRFDSSIDQPGSARLKRIMYFPIINDVGETIAVIQSARENKKFTGDEISYLEMISKQMEAAIVRAKNLEAIINEEKLTGGKKLRELIIKEISVPIDIIDGYSKILGQKKLPAETEDIIRMLQKQADSVRDISDTIFKVLLNEIVLENTKIHFNEFIDDVLELLSEYCETRDAKLFKKIGEGAVVEIDRSKLYTAMFQFIKTCIDDSKSDGKIYFSTELAGDAILITIQNEGKGSLTFPEGNVLDYFYVKSKIKEDEIGLLLAVRIVEAHSGEVELDSVRGVGSTFRIKIPLSLK